MSVKVAVRVRPFNQREKFLGCLNCIQMENNTTILINPRDRSQKEYQYTFDYSLWSHNGFEELENGYLYPIDDRYIDQKKLYKELGADIIHHAWQGYNCCLFAYGQTGAGKSYSMIGYGVNRGILPIACEKLFVAMDKKQVMGKMEFEVHVSMIEIYNEKVQDLFVHTSKRPPNGLRIRENRSMGVYVEAATKYQVYDYEQIEKRMEQGAKNRSLASTLMNQYSSRAHTIVMIQFIQKQFITDKYIFIHCRKMNKRTSLINLVDLAGSERVTKTGILNNRDRLKEASQINKSLHTLGRVIEALAEVTLVKGKNVQIPYRQSALTRILETALGGNSVTTMICAISPANDNYEETLSTLRYADQAKKIKNKPIINESAVDKIIRELREENERLKQMLRLAKLKGINLEEGENLRASINQIQREIKKNMQSFAINTNEGNDEDEELLLTSFIELQNPNDFGDGTKNPADDDYMAYLTNLSEDQFLNFKIKYSCQTELYIGNKNLQVQSKNKMILCGLGIQDQHASIFHLNGRYFLLAFSETSAQYTLVNGRSIEVDKDIQLFHNDRVIFGTNSVFLFKAKSREKKKIDEKQLDYEFAINQRNNKMLDTSNSSSLFSNIKTDQVMIGKLEQIERQFYELKKENQRKMKQKQEIFKEEMKKIQLERIIEKEKMKQQMREKDEKAKQILKQKQKIEKLRDRLLKMEEQRKEKENAMKKARESMLLEINEEEFETFSKRQDLKTEVMEQQIQYIDRHHYHYDYNLVEPEVNKEEDTRANTTTNLHKFENEKQQTTQEKEINTFAKKQVGKSMMNAESGSNPQNQGQMDKKKTMKFNHAISVQYEPIEGGNNLDKLNFTDILDTEEKRKLSMASSQQQNLLNMTEHPDLESYLPDQQIQRDRAQSENQAQQNRGTRKSSGSVSFTISELSSQINHLSKEAELTDRIKELEQRLKKLSQFEENMKKDQLPIESDDREKIFDDELSLSQIGLIKSQSDNSFQKQLQRKFVQCQNENILNERTIQIRKRKRESQQLRQTFLRKQRREINKQLINLIPMLQKFNLYARQMGRNVEGKIHIQFRNFTNHQVVEALKHSNYKSKINIKIKVLNYEQGRHYKWPIEIFENRFEIVENIFEKYIQNPNSSYFTLKDKVKDPFWEPIEFQNYAFAYLSMECLLYGLDFEGKIRCVCQGKIIGFLNVRIAPLQQDANVSKLQQKLTTTNFDEIIDPRAHLERDIIFTIEINSFHPASEFSHLIAKYKISYQLLSNTYKGQKYETCEIKADNEEIMYMYKHRFKDISQSMLAEISDCPILINLMVVYEVDDELCSMTSSFLGDNSQVSEFNSSFSDGQKTVDERKYSRTPTGFSKKRDETSIIENQEFMEKLLVKKHNSEKKKVAVDKNLLKKKQGKDDKDCHIF